MSDDVLTPYAGPKGRWLRLAYYFRPHLFGVLGSVGLAWAVRTLSVMGGECRVLCYPPVTIGMGVLGGLLGAQLYRSENPLLPPPDDDGA
jgi:hypothetical protein